MKKSYHGAVIGTLCDVDLGPSLAPSDRAAILCPGNFRSVTDVRLVHDFRRSLDDGPKALGEWWDEEHDITCQASRPQKIREPCGYGRLSVTPQTLPRGDCP